MTESMLQSLMKLFALLATLSVDATKLFSRNLVETFLKGQFSNKLVDKSLVIYDQQIVALSQDKASQRKKRISSLSVKILMICDEINRELHLKSKFAILFSAIQFSKHFEAHVNKKSDLKETIRDALDTVAESLKIDINAYRNCSAFINEKFYKVPDKSSLLLMSGNASASYSGIKYEGKEGLKGQFFFLRIEQADLYLFYYLGKEQLEMGGKSVFPNHVYLFPKGSSIKSEGFNSIYYEDVVSAFRKEGLDTGISLSVDKLDFRYPKSEIGIHELSMQLEAGEFVGVMGGSGTGKSTLMYLMNGSLKPRSGSVSINGWSVIDNKEELEGMIGHVPQDDLLIEELSVYDNLYYNAKLCLGEKSEKDILMLIARLLNSLGLFYIKDLKVGSPLNKTISGGQRKRLNIALELIREPYVLFVDEPTSGLSSTDSENVLQLLKEQALSGKIVVVNIHQPSSDLFKLFNKVVIMDKGGYPVYIGNPLESVSYLKNVAHRADATEIECETCGTVHTDDILKIIEAKSVNEFGEYNEERLLEPIDWYKMFKEEVEKPIEKTEVKTLPKLPFRIPDTWKQYIIYARRNFFSKLADKQFVILALSITPVLALILGFFTKYFGGNEDGNQLYVFSLNENLPVYLFMCVIVAVFIGLIISAEEIIKDRKILAREEFLNLSRAAYLNSKIIFLFVLTAFQMFVFLIIGHGILGVNGLTFVHWTVMFSTAAFAVLLGLNISAGLKSIISIYINIPFLIVPLMLLAGVIVSFDKIHPAVAGKENVPLAGDIMASRWAYEALVVSSFRYNAYESHFFEIEKAQANTLYNVNFLIPELENRVYDFRQALASNDEQNIKRLGKVIESAIPELEGIPSSLLNEKATEIDLNLFETYLSEWKSYLFDQSASLDIAKDELLDSLVNAMGGNAALVELKRKHHNSAVSDMALSATELVKIVEIDGCLVRKETPVFQDPVSRVGRAHFLASSKFIGRSEINTVVFNNLILWLMTIVLYIALLNDWLRKLLDINIFRKTRK